MFSVARKHFELNNNNKTKFLVSREFLEIVQPPSPKKYTELEYIESSGTQYIDTGILSQTPIYCETKFILTKLEDTPMLGSIGLNSSERFQLIDIYQSRWHQGYNSSYSTTYSLATTQSENNMQIWFESGRQEIINNGVSVGKMTNTGNLNYNRNILLFKKQNNENKISAKLFYLKMFKNSSTILNLLPVKDTEGVVCMYDKVSDTFFYNQGIGNFIAGPEVNT